MAIDRRGLGAALAILLLVAACGGSATSAPSAAASASSAATETPPATEAATPTEAASTASPESSFEASFAPGAAGDLEAMLPTDVNGVKFTRTSFTGESIPAGVPITDSDLSQLLKDNGKSLSDVRVAIATPTEAASQGNLVMAIQIKGIDAGKLKAWAIKSIGDATAPATTVGGKQVYGSSQAGFGAYLYVKGDVAFYVVAVGAGNMAEGIISKLP